MFEPNRVYFFDTTLRDGEQAAGVNLNVQEKLQIAKQLEKMKVDVIEAGFPAASPGDFSCVQAIARETRNSVVAALARTREGDVRAAAQALAQAEKPRLHVFLATSPLHMEHKLRMTPEEVLNEARAGVSLARSLAAEVEFSAEDACRSDPDFLIKVFKTAVEAGAVVLNIPDTVGYAVPDEFGALCRKIIEGVAAPEGVIFSVHAHDDLGLATANSLAAVKAGVRQVEATVNGMGERAGNSALEEVVMGLRTRSDFYGLTSALETKRLYPVSRLVSRLCGTAVPPNKAVVGANAFAHESGIHQHGVMAERTTYEIMTPASVGIPQSKMVLGKHSGRHAFEERLNALGFELTGEALQSAFERFKALADKKKTVQDNDLEAIAGQLEQTLPGPIELMGFVINAGTLIDGTAIIKLRVGERVIQKVAMGDGPADAAFKAINEIVGQDFTLDTYQLGAITEGGDAMGECVLRLTLDGRTVTGRGVSTDIIEATIKSYIHAANKLLG
ncbi:MAG: 2-isopropylmalate synthase [Oscillospiraceae bacterium]|jgi:2-isopropylmalate synthase|nr:2-isopropylmalate synthase [Oscillospiraceae bacterium]